MATLDGRHGDDVLRDAVALLRLRHDERSKRLIDQFECALSDHGRDDPHCDVHDCVSVESAREVLATRGQP